MNIGFLPFGSVVATLLLASSAAVADEADKFYLGASVGTADFHGSQFDESNTAWGLQLGWNFNQYIGLELAYTDFQEFSSRIEGQTSPHPTGASVAAILRYPVSSRISLFGKVGMTRVDTDIAAANPFYDGSQTEDNASYGLGADLRIGSSWKLRIAYDVTEMNLGTIQSGSFYTKSNGDLDRLSAGVAWEF